MDPADWRLVRSTPLFGTVSQEVAQSLIGNQPVSVYKKGDTLFRQGEPADCETRVAVHTRPMTVYFGTVQTSDGKAQRDVVELTDRITANLRNALASTAPDERIGLHLAPWVDDEQNDMEWILGAAENRDAEQAMLDAFEAFRQQQGGKTLDVAGPVDRGRENLLIAL